mmetsp:Transcript_57985/g.125334  ORF Transcript_57985/g.125334 Transcript_57985/m.125334 type:complete len:200 (+) Transcript_57985:715-1314(+)
MSSSVSASNDLPPAEISLCTAPPLAGFPFTPEKASEPPHCWATVRQLAGCQERSAAAAAPRRSSVLAAARSRSPSASSVVSNHWRGSSESPAKRTASEDSRASRACRRGFVLWSTTRQAPTLGWMMKPARHRSTLSSLLAPASVPSVCATATTPSTEPLERFRKSRSTRRTKAAERPDEPRITTKFRVPTPRPPGRWKP